MYQITDWCRHFISLQVKPGDCCIDATMGNGHDTVLLCRCAGGTGRVLAFDIQPQALKNTKTAVGGRCTGQLPADPGFPQPYGTIC